MSKRNRNITAARRGSHAESSRNTSMTVLALAAAVCAAQAPERAWAQQGVSSGGDLGELQEVVVTATKREEPLSKVPEAIQVFTGEILRDQGVVDVTDLQNVATGLNVTRSTWGLDLNIRGVTTTDYTVKGSQGIGFQVDGVPINRPTPRGVAFFDVNDVEVLRGPQGTLYGTSTTGGTVNVRTNRPGDEFGITGQLEAGNYSTVRAQAAVNMPLSEGYAMRVAVNSNDRDGYLIPVDGGAPRNDQKDRTARISFRGKFNDIVTGYFTTTFGQIRGVGAGTVPLGNLQSSGGKTRSLFPDPLPQSVDDSFVNLDGEIDVQLGEAAQLTYIGTHQYFNDQFYQAYGNDPAGNATPPAYWWNHERIHDTTDYHELRVSNSNPGRIDYVAGVNYLREPIEENYHTFLAPVTTPTVAQSTSGVNPINVTTLDTKSAFGQATFHMTDVIGFVAGLRYSTDKVDRTGTFSIGNTDLNGNTCVAPNDCVGGPNNGSNKASKLTYRGGINLQFTPHNLLYASVSTGYKPGGFNDFDPVTGGIGHYDPEQLTAYEVGYKGRPINTLQFNSTFFYYNYSKDQISSVVLFPVANGGLVGVIYTRAVPAKISGWENELTYEVTPNTSVSLNGAFERSHYVRFQAGIFQNIDWNGFRLDNTPSFVGSVGVNHSIDLANGGSLKLRAFTKYSSSYLLSDFVNAVQYRQKAFTRSDANVTYSSPHDTYFVQAFVQNIENKLQAVGAPNYNDAALAGNQNAAWIYVSTPRFWGLRAGINIH